MLILENISKSIKAKQIVKTFQLASKKIRYWLLSFKTKNFNFEKAKMAGIRLLSRISSLLMVIILISCEKSSNPTSETENIILNEIVFVSEREVYHKYDIFAMDINGKNQHPLTSEMAFSDRPIFSPDGQHILFLSKINGISEIFLMDIDGRNKINISKNMCNNYDPEFSSDGSKIVFSRERQGGGDMDIFMVNSDGSDQKNLSNKIGYETHPHFSPDGKKICFIFQSPDYNTDIFIMDTDDKEMTNLTQDTNREMSLCFSHNGLKIIYEIDIVVIHGINYKNICTMDADGSNKVNLTNSIHIDERFFDISLDDSKILYSENLLQDLYIMNIDGNNKIKLTGGLRSFNKAQLIKHDTQIIFDCWRDGWDIYRIDIDGKNLVNLTGEQGDGMYPDFRSID